MAVFALLEYALTFGALGNLPGVCAADLIMSPPTGVCRTRLLNVSCSGDFPANSAHQIDRDPLSRGERWQCRTNVLATLIVGTCASSFVPPERDKSVVYTGLHTFKQSSIRSGIWDGHVFRKISGWILP